MLLRLMLLGVALASPSEDLARGFRVDDTEGWVAEGGQIRATDGLALQLSDTPAGEEPQEQLSVADIGRERAALAVELAARKLKVVDLQGRVVTTPLGEPMVLVEYAIEPAKGFEGVAPKQGARVTRRCGPTVRVTWEGEAVQSSRVLDAAQQLLWGEADCERFNARAFHKTSNLSADAAPPPPSIDASTEPPRSSGPSTGEILGVGALVLVVFGVAFKRAGARAPAPQASPTRPPPRRAVVVDEVRPAPAPEPRRPEPRALGAMGAQEGVWVVPVLPRPTAPPPDRLPMPAPPPPEPEAVAPRPSSSPGPPKTSRPSGPPCPRRLRPAPPPCRPRGRRCCTGSPPPTRRSRPPPSRSPRSTPRPRRRPPRSIRTPCACPTWRRP